MVQLELFPELSIPEQATEAPLFIEVLATCHAALNVVGEPLRGGVQGSLSAVVCGRLVPVIFDARAYRVSLRLCPCLWVMAAVKRGPRFQAWRQQGLASDRAWVFSCR